MFALPRKARITLAALLALVALVLALTPLVGEQVVRRRILPELTERLGRKVGVQRIRIRWGRVVLEDLVVAGPAGEAVPPAASGTPAAPAGTADPAAPADPADPVDPTATAPAPADTSQASAAATPPLHIPRLTIEFAVAPLLLGRVSLTTVTVERPRITLIRGASGEDNISSLLAQLRRRRTEPSASPRSGEGRLGLPEVVRIEAGQIDLTDEELGTAAVERLDARIERAGPGHAELSHATLQLGAGPAGQAERITVDFRHQRGHLDGLPAIAVSGGALAFWKGFSLTGIHGGITPDPADATRVQVDLRGGYGGVDRVLWDARGWIQPAAREGDVQLRAARFDLGQLKPILTKTPIIDPEQAQVGASVRLHYHRVPAEGQPSTGTGPGTGPGTTPDTATAAAPTVDAVDFDGRFALAGLSVFHPMLGTRPVRDLGFMASATGTLQPKQRTLRIKNAHVEYRGVSADLSLYAEKLGRRPAFDAWLTIPPVPCQTALQALPEELTPSLQGFRMSGQFKTQLHVAIDLSDLDQGVALDGSVGINGCTVQGAPQAMLAERLQEPFDHAVELSPGQWLTFVVGPDNPDWVPYPEISPHVINSIMTTEDSTFMRHHGFIVSEFRSALKANLERGYFRLGASSITMQMVKNVLLTREKTLSRKLQEMFLTWYMEKSLTKERILEIYFNVVEFGPGIYGIGRAARHYFGKAAHDLTPRESAWFSSIMPNPKKRYVHYCHGAPDNKWELYLNRILKRMHERGRLTDAEYAQALGEHLVFDRTEAMPERQCLELIKRLTTPPPGTQVQATATPTAEDSTE